MNKRNNLHQFLIASVAILIIAFMILQLKISVGDLITVETAELASFEETIEATGYIIRNERIVSSTTTGVVSYLVNDSQKVASGSNVLAIYSNPDDAKLQSQINELRSKIEVLEKSTLLISSNLSAIDESIQSLMLQTIRKTEKNDIGTALFGSEDLLVLMNKKQALKGIANFLTLKQTLENEITYLENAMGGQRTIIKADRAGYFYSSVDGYESIFLPSAIPNLSIDNFETLISSKPNLIASNTAVGKIVYDSKWYIICKIDKRTASTLVEGKAYDFEYLHTNNIRMPMVFERSIVHTDSDEAVVVFHSQEMPDGFSFKREQPLRIVLGRYEGLEVPIGSIRKKGGESGVHIVKGNIVMFRRVEIIYQKRNSFICRLPDERDKAKVSKTHLSLYDMIIVGGKDIYDGKVLK